MRKALTTLTLLLLGFFSFSTPVAAHVLRADGPIGAVIHITPADDPIIGKDATFAFEFKDKENKFKVSACDCVFTISRNGEELFNQTLPKNDSGSGLESPVFTYVFLEKGIYQIQMSGKPVLGANFQNFNLKYDLRVERTGESIQESSLNIPAIFVGFAIFLTVIYSLYQFVFKKKPKDPTTKNSKSKADKFLVSFLIFVFAMLPTLSLIASNHHAQASSKQMGLSEHPCCLPRANDELTANLTSIELTPAKGKVIFEQQGTSEDRVRSIFNKSPPTFG